MPTNTIERYLEAKAAEDQARALRISIEEDLIAELGAKSEGSITHTVGDYKVTLTGRINRRLDEKVWSAIVDEIPEDLRPVKYKAEIDTRGLRYLQEHEPAVYATVARAITAAPGKAGVTVKATDER
jgi:hypothetical protein